MGLCRVLDAVVVLVDCLAARLRLLDDAGRDTAEDPLHTTKPDGQAVDFVGDHCRR